MASKSTLNPKSTKAKKSNSSKQSFNLRSPKIQFIVTILVIAILGGGYFTLKSFADTSSTYTLAAGTLKLSTGASQYVDPGKNNSAVASVPPGQNASVGGVGITNNQRYKVCIYASSTPLSNAEGKLQVMTVGLSTPTAGIAANFTVPKQSGYANYCTIILSSPIGVSSLIVANTGNGGVTANLATIRIANVTVTRYDTTPAPAPAPQPTK